MLLSLMLHFGNPIFGLVIVNHIITTSRPESPIFSFFRINFLKTAVTDEHCVQGTSSSYMLGSRCNIDIQIEIFLSLVLHNAVLTDPLVNNMKTFWQRILEKNNCNSSDGNTFERRLRLAGSNENWLMRICIVSSLFLLLVVWGCFPKWRGWGPLMR